MRPKQRSVASTAAAAAAVVLLAAGSATADPSPRECIAAADRGQLLQKTHNLTIAREMYRVCAAPTCPTEVQHACIQWLEVADKAQPTLAFSVTDAAGADLTDVQVTVDDQPFVSKLAGAAVEIDPGEHTFRFKAPGYVSLTRKVIIVEGEKMRRARVILEKPGGAAAVPVHRAATAAAPEQPAPEATLPPEHSGAQKTAGVIVLALGLAAIGTGVGFTIDYIINKTNLSSDGLLNYDLPKNPPINNPCFVNGTPNTQTNDGCSAQNNAQTAEDVLIATFIAGGVVTIVGITIMATAHADLPEPGHPNAWLRDLQVVPSVAPGQASMLLRGRF